MVRTRFLEGLLAGQSFAHPNGNSRVGADGRPWLGVMSAVQSLSRQRRRTLIADGWAWIPSAISSAVIRSEARIAPKAASSALVEGALGVVGVGDVREVPLERGAARGIVAVGVPESDDHPFPAESGGDGSRSGKLGSHGDLADRALAGSRTASASSTDGERSHLGS